MNKYRVARFLWLTVYFCFGSMW